MPFQILIEPGKHSLSAEPDQTILEAALEAGLVIPYGCRDGACGSCKGQVLSGEVMLDRFNESALSPAEQAAGQTLFCRARPLSDLVIQPRHLTRGNDFPVKKLPCRVQALERVAPDVMVLTVKLPASEAFQFRAGQYIDFLLQDGRRRSFSIANAPKGAEHLELHVRLVDQGSFTTHVFNTMKVRDILRFEGPLGTFWLNESQQKPAILLAGGTGFAPIKAIVEDALERGLERQFVLYWGARDQAGLYMHDKALEWARSLPGFRYVPVLSEAEHDGSWNGRKGLVHQAVIEDHPDLSGHEVYACGAPGMIDAARADFVARCKLPPEAFHSDAFTFASDAKS